MVSLAGAIIMIGGLTRAIRDAISVPLRVTYKTVDPDDVEQLVSVGYIVRAVGLSLRSLLLPEYEAYRTLNSVQLISVSNLTYQPRRFVDQEGLTLFDVDATCSVRDLLI